MGLVLIVLGSLISFFTLVTFQRIPMIGCYASTIIQRDAQVGLMKFKDPLCISEGLFYGAIGFGGLLVLIGLALLIRGGMRGPAAPERSSELAPAPAAPPPSAFTAGGAALPPAEPPPATPASAPAFHSTADNSPSAGDVGPLRPRSEAMPAIPSGAPQPDLTSLAAELEQFASRALPPPPPPPPPAAPQEGAARLAEPRAMPHRHPASLKVSHRPVPPPVERARRSSYGVAAFLILVVIAEGAAGFYLYRRHEDTQRRDADLVKERGRLDSLAAQLAADRQKAATEIEGQKAALRRDRELMELRAAERDAALRRDREQLELRAAQLDAAQKALPGPSAPVQAAPAITDTGFGVVPAGTDTSFGVVPAGTALPADTAQLQEVARACDRLAANPSDKNKPAAVPGVPFGALRANAAAAIAACEEAMTTFPDQPRFTYQYGRALQAVSPARAKDAFSQAIQSGYPAAYDNLANILIGEKRFGEAAYFLREGVKKGDGDAAITLAGLIEARQVGGAYPTEVLDLYQLAANSGNANAARRLQEIVSQQQLQQNMLGIFQMMMPVVRNR